LAAQQLRYKLDYKRNLVKPISHNIAKY